MLICSLLESVGLLSKSMAGSDDLFLSSGLRSIIIIFLERPKSSKVRDPTLVFDFLVVWTATVSVMAPSSGSSYFICFILLFSL